MIFTSKHVITFYSKYECLFSLIANFDYSVEKLGSNLSNFQRDVRMRANDGQDREKDLKTLNASTAQIAYHPSTALSKC